MGERIFKIEDGGKVWGEGMERKFAFQMLEVSLFTHLFNKDEKQKNKRDCGWGLKRFLCPANTYTLPTPYTHKKKKR